MRLALDLSVDQLAGSLRRILSASLLCHFSLSDAGMSGTVSGAVVAGGGRGNVTRTPAWEFLVISHHLTGGSF